jgi:hypothetical protein
MTGRNKKLTDELIHQMTDEQRLALQELAEIAAKELRLSREITELTENVRKAHQALGFKASQSPKNLSEDPEIDVLVTSKARYKIENVREQIKRSLNKAIDLGLGDLEIIQRQAKIYGVPLKDN